MSSNFFKRYIYDLAIPPNLKDENLSCFVPAPLDGEVESFEASFRIP